MNYANRKGQDLLHTPEGVRDCYGKENYAKQNTIEKIADQIHLYGYEDLQTPSFEYFDVFSNEIGTTSSRELYKFFDKEGDTLVLRPDFTPSVARCVSATREVLSATLPTCRASLRRLPRWARSL